MHPMSLNDRIEQLLDWHDVKCDDIESLKHDMYELVKKTHTVPGYVEELK